ncbi:hypothetical protein BDP55DRAFT_761449 [Colletotrichum godetiae]|uniref:F-box domain-containing protein n=1 Tax=Colletotrichum godetiae TaxID=1209918 RepID=A0AAJ0F188_9PEZI|nr:uncharacterized protein BDP55DRAFT_761449 [Colletotrichum godetiae]KAK1689262.1 hypothetical protein BDP55DRAFT_761449 [Colletotrichum godetiae]
MSPIIVIIAASEARRANQNRLLEEERRLPWAWSRRFIDAFPFRTENKNAQGLDRAMPTELLLAISGYLTMVDRAVLSLTSRRMWAIFEKDNFLLSLPSPKKIELPTLLERDANEHKNGNVLCRPCQIFHDPHLTSRSIIRANNRDYNRPCLQEPANSHQRLVSPYLHDAFPFNSFKHAQACRRSVENPYDANQLYLVKLPTLYRHDNEKARAEQTMTCRVSKEGELLVKTVTDLFAAKGDIPYLYQVLERTNLTRCCGHVDWEATYPFMFEHNMQYPTDPDEYARCGQPLARDDLRRIHDVWNPAVEPQHSLGNERMNARAFCYTNYTHGEDVNDMKWASHFKYRGYIEEDFIRRDWWEGFDSRYAWDEPDESERKAETWRDCL